MLRKIGLLIAALLITALLVAALLTPVPAGANDPDPLDAACGTVEALGCETYYADRDGDGYGDPQTGHRSPVAPDGEVTNPDDCDDTDADVHPGAIETFDGRDENCDGTIDVTLVITELMVNPRAVPDFDGEYVEVASTSEADADLGGVTLAVGFRLCDLGGILGGGEALVVARSQDPEENGGFLADAECFFTLTNSGTTVEVTASTGTLDVVDYTGFSVPDGASLNLDPQLTDPSANDDPAAWCPATSVLPSGDRGTPGTPNDAC